MKCWLEQHEHLPRGVQPNSDAYLPAPTTATPLKHTVPRHPRHPLMISATKRAITAMRKDTLHLLVQSPAATRVTTIIMMAALPAGQIIIVTGRHKVPRGVWHTAGPDRKSVV